MLGGLMMMNWKHIAAAGLLALMSPLTAHATGNADCSIEEPGLKLFFEGLYSYGGTGEIFQSHASIELTDPKRPPGDWTFDMDGSVLQQQWVRGDDFRVLIYKEREGADMVLEIKAKRTTPDDIEFPGTYKLVIGPSDGSLFSRTGNVACSAG
jgi:hypothetical protein